MKKLLIILGICFGLNASAATVLYPMLTDSETSRLLPAGVTNLVTKTGTNVLTGTNRYTGTVIITNAASTISGNGAGLTNLSAGNIASGSLADARLSSNVPLKDGANTFTTTQTLPLGSLVSSNEIATGSRVLWSFPTNGMIVAHSGGSSFTNNGDFASCTSLGILTLPPLRSVNSTVYFSYHLEHTNAEAAASGVYFYVGNATNYVGGTSASAFSSAAYTRISAGPVHLFTCQNSSTNQAGGSQAAATWYSTNFVGDTSATWTMYIGFAAQTGGQTNQSIKNLKLIEMW